MTVPPPITSMSNKAKMIQPGPFFNAQPNLWVINDAWPEDSHLRLTNSNIGGTGFSLEGKNYEYEIRMSVTLDTGAFHFHDVTWRANTERVFIWSAALKWFWSYTETVDIIREQLEDKGVMKLLLPISPNNGVFTVARIDSASYKTVTAVTFPDAYGDYSHSEPQVMFARNEINFELMIRAYRDWIVGYNLNGGGEREWKFPSIELQVDGAYRKRPDYERAYFKSLYGVSPEGMQIMPTAADQPKI